MSSEQWVSVRFISSTETVTILQVDLVPSLDSILSVLRRSEDCCVHIYDSVQAIKAGEHTSR